jgi:Zn-dependent peptidase ImmA (M78 family)/transcriptional regulator with XRE-family HTH domain
MLRSRSLDDDDRIFNPARLELARKRRGLKKTELAAAAGIDPRTLLNYDAGIQPSRETVLGLASALKFPEAFFFGEDIEEIDSSTVSFRSMARMTASQRDQAEGQGAMCIQLNDWFAKRFAMPPCTVPNVRHATPEIAAMIVRTEWGLGVQPVSNMIHLLESRGVRIYSLSVKVREVDAFSTWKGPTPYIMLNVQKSSEHSRFDAAHELGHLVLHRDGSPVGKEAEGEANRFASAFLMPEADVLSYARPNPGLAALIQWKKRWGVSLVALAYRMHQMGLITEHHYKGLCIQISIKGGRTREIDGIPRERSQLLDKMLRMLAQDGVNRSQIARELLVTPAELDEMMFGLTMTAFDGNRKGKAASASGDRTLMLVP